MWSVIFAYTYFSCVQCLLARIVQHVSRHWTQKSNTKQQHLDYVEHGHTRKQKPCQNTNNQHCQIQHFDFLTKTWNKKWKHSTHIDNFELTLATMDFSLNMYQEIMINVELIQQWQWSSQIILTTIKLCRFLKLHQHLSWGVNEPSPKKWAKFIPQKT